MTDLDRLEQRLSAVERVVVDGDATLDELAEVAALAETVAELETRVEEHEQRLADLEAAVRSLEGYVGNVESITDDVERQAASAVATVDRLERRVDRLEVELDDVRGGVLANGRGPAAEGDRLETAGSDGGSRDGSDDGTTGGNASADGLTEGTSLEFAEFATDDAGDTDPRPDTGQTPEETVTAIVAGSDEPQSVEDETGRVDRPTQADDETDSGDGESGLFASLRARFP